MSTESYISSLEDLTIVNLEKVRTLVLDINDKLQLLNDSQIIFECHSIYDTEIFKTDDFNEIDYSRGRQESIKFLYDQKVITTYRAIFNEVDEVYGEFGGLDLVKTKKVGIHRFQVTVDIERFKDFKKEIEKLHKRILDSDESVDFDIPDGTKWEDIKIKFKDGLTVKILVHDKVYDKTCRELGFEDKRTLKPNEQWKLLGKLAHEGGITWGDKPATWKIKSRKHLLSKKLRSIFRINSDPFMLYTSEHGYRLKFTLVPED